MTISIAGALRAKDAQIQQLMNAVESRIRARVEMEAAAKKASIPSPDLVSSGGGTKGGAAKANTANPYLRSQVGSAPEGHGVLLDTETTNTAQRGFITGDYIPIEVRRVAADQYAANGGGVCCQRHSWAPDSNRIFVLCALCTFRTLDA